MSEEITVSLTIDEHLRIMLDLGDDLRDGYISKLFYPEVSDKVKKQVRVYCITRAQMLKKFDGSPKVIYKQAKEIVAERIERRNNPSRFMELDHKTGTIRQR